MDTGSIASSHIVKTGTFMYAGEIECDICIIHSPVQYGTGDADDPPEIADDVSVNCYYVHYGSTTERGAFSARSEAFPSIQEAMHGANSQLGASSALRWHEGRASEA